MGTDFWICQVHWAQRTTPWQNSNLWTVSEQEAALPSAAHAVLRKGHFEQRPCVQEQKVHALCRVLGAGGTQWMVFPSERSLLQAYQTALGLSLGHLRSRLRASHIHSLREP